MQTEKKPARACKRRKEGMKKTFCVAFAEEAREEGKLFIKREAEEGKSLVLRRTLARRPEGEVLHPRAHT